MADESGTAGGRVAPPQTHRETVSVRMPRGTAARIRLVAGALGYAPSEWHRAILRDALEAAERKTSRAKVPVG